MGTGCPKAHDLSSKSVPGTVPYQQTGATGGAVSGRSLFGLQATSPGRGSGMQMRKESVRLISIFGPRMGDQFWHACTSVRQRLTKRRSMQALIMSSQAGSTPLNTCAHVRHGQTIFLPGRVRERETHKKKTPLHHSRSQGAL